ncbi:MFS transporter [Brucella pituitosa]|uniref:MFS transporter n=1 Tax=Brucella pituitosa TaxID=571256 RepID=UPI003C73F15A
MTVTTANFPTEREARLPIAALLALAMSGFICIVTETLPAGLLPQIGNGLGVSQALAGQTVTAYAVGSLLAAIPLTIATSSWRRRNVLLLTLAGFLVFNMVTAVSNNYWLTLTSRFFAGVAAGLAWSLLAGYARRMVSPDQQGKAMAIAMVGTPIALSLGVPIGTWLGTAVGWRAAFWIMSALTIVLVFWVIAKVPDYPGIKRSGRIPLTKVLRTPGVLSVLAVVIMWMLAHNILYTYIAPFVAPAGLSNRVDLVLLVFGITALAGIGVTGKLVDRALRKTVLASLLVFTMIALAFALLSASPTLEFTGVAIWGLTFGGAATLLQTALADTAGDGADVALSMNVVAWNSAVAGGGIVGGILLNTYGVSSFSWAVVLLLVMGLILAWRARSRGFPAGHRTSGTKIAGH